jgi:hypothetical protein
MDKHLEERTAYEERYDRHTVEKCRWHEEPRPASDAKIDGEPPTDGQLQWCHDLVTDWMLFQCAGNRYLTRETTIDKWMERDRRRDVMMENAKTPRMLCPSCGKVMECIHTHLGFDFDSDNEWVEFFLGCKPCKESMHVFEDGREIPRKPSLCVQCNKEVECDTQEKDGKRCYIDTCKHCGHVEETVSILEEDKEPTKEEIERFEYDKKRFCLSSQQGERYKNWKEGMKRMDAQKKENEQNTDLYDRLAEIKKLNIAAVEKLLKAALKKAHYDDFHLTMPASGNEIVIEFSVRDLKDDREEYDSQKSVQQAIDTALDNTNWSLMPNSIDYRLGLLSGRIKGYETEPDLESLTKSRIKKRGKGRKVLSK